MRFAIVFLFLAHGIAHLVGFAAAWKLGNFPDLPFKTTVLGGALDLGESGIRVMGLAWVALAAAFVLSAAGLVLLQPWWTSAAWWAIGMSLVVCLVNLPEARVGVAMNIGLALLVLAVVRFGMVRVP